MNQEEAASSAWSIAIFVITKLCCDLLFVLSDALLRCYSYISGSAHLKRKMGSTGSDCLKKRNDVMC